MDSTTYKKIQVGQIFDCKNVKKEFQSEKLLFRF